MADHLTCTWTGASGKKYIYEIYARHPKLAANEPGNFIYAKIDEHKRRLMNTRDGCRSISVKAT